MTLEHKVVFAQCYCFLTAFTDGILSIRYDLGSPKRVKIATLTCFGLLASRNDPDLVQRGDWTHVICKFRVKYVDKSALRSRSQLVGLEVCLCLINS